MLQPKQRVFPERRRHPKEQPVKGKKGPKKCSFEKTNRNDATRNSVKNEAKSNVA
jgi:hypothetical protein